MGVSETTRRELRALVNDVRAAALALDGAIDGAAERYDAAVAVLIARRPVLLKRLRNSGAVSLAVRLEFAPLFRRGEVEGASMEADGRLRDLIHYAETLLRATETAA